MFNKIKGDEAYFIAEVGQNHNGSTSVALEYIKRFSDAGADAVKFQTRNNKILFSDEAYNKSYNSENSFADTYGKHREILELNGDDLILLKEECARNGVDFISTPFDEPSLKLLVDVGVDALKVASFDIGNLPFLYRIAKTGLPVVMSVGGGKPSQIRDSVRILEEYSCKLAILHCVSEYPCPAERLGLSGIVELMRLYPNHVIGSSDHFNGILSGPVAFMLGARVFEKHVTFDRSSKGTDHSFALEPDGFRKFVRDVKRTPIMLPQKAQESLGEEPVFQKLGKSVVARRHIKAGTSISLDDLSGRIFETQLVPVRDSASFLGKVALADIAEGEPVLPEHVSK